MRYAAALSMVVVVGLAACTDPRREEIERRNQAYQDRKAAEDPPRTIASPEINELDLAKIDQLMSCTPERPGWPVDEEACDLSTAKVNRLAAAPVFEELAQRAEMDATLAGANEARQHQEAIDDFMGRHP